MARQVDRLNARTAVTIKEPGRHADGRGLYLSVSENGGRRWVFLFRQNGRLREMGLGGQSTVSLVQARKLAERAREELAEARQGRGPDPIARKRGSQSTATFAECVNRFLARREGGWKNEKHRDQWRNTLDTYAMTTLGKMAVADIDVGHVTKVLEPIWGTKNETASRLRGRIEAVLDWAKLHNYRTGDNPAKWKGHLDKHFEKRSAVRQVKHHPALPYAEMASFMNALRAQQGIAALALQFLILTAARTGEVIGARWNEIDLKAKTWTVPAERMKMRLQHVVPLSDSALAILKAPPGTHGSADFIFLGGRAGKALSNNAMLALLERMDRSDITAHGFRSSFQDWVSETTNFPQQVTDAALAHVVGDKTEAAYRRGDLFQKRTRLMAAWDGYCNRAAGTVVPMARTTTA